jgi:hypothetical protein
MAFRGFSNSSAAAVQSRWRFVLKQTQFGKKTVGNVMSDLYVA